MAAALKLRHITRVKGEVPVALHAPSRTMAVSASGSCLTQRPSRFHLCDWNAPETVAKYSATVLCGFDRICFSPDGRLIATGHFSSQYYMDGRIVSLNDKKEHEFHLGNVSTLSPFKPSGSQCVRFDGTGQWLAIADGAGPSVRVVGVGEVLAGKPVIRGAMRADGVVGTRALCWSPDGKLVAQEGGAVVLWNLERDGENFKVSHHGTLNYANMDKSSGSMFKQDPPVGMAFRPDGRILAVGGSGRQADRIKLFDVKESAELSASPDLTARVSWLGFTDDGAMLLSGSMDGMVRHWRVQEVDGKPCLELVGETKLTGAVYDAVILDRSGTAMVAYLPPRSPDIYLGEVRA